MHKSENRRESMCLVSRSLDPGLWEERAYHMGGPYAQERDTLEKTGVV